MAGQLAKSGKWVLNEHGSGADTVCEAITTDSGFLRSYSLRLSKTKNSDKPLEIFLHETGKLNYGPLAMTSVNHEVALFSEYSVADKSRFFWYLPDETKQLTDHLRTAKGNLEVVPFGDLEGGKLKFSLSGAAEIIASMEKLCNQGQPLVEQRFSALTDHPASFDQNPKIFDGTTLVAVRAGFYDLAAHFARLLEQERELKKLEDANAPAIQERKRLQMERADLANKKIPELKQDISATTLRIQNGERRLGQLRSEIPAAEKQRATAQTRYDTASQKIAPHQPKHNELSNEISRAQRALSGAVNDKASFEREHSANISTIRQLEREAQLLTQSIQRLRSEVSHAQSKAEQARREYNSYDADYEYRRLLQSSSRYHSLKRESDNIRNQINRERGELVNLQRDLSRVQSQMSQCISKPENNCDHLASQVRDKQNQVRSKESDISRLNSQYDSNRRGMDRIESSIRNDVQRVSDRLRHAYDVALTNLNRLQSRIAQEESLRNDITNYRIPQLINRNGDLKIRIADLDRQIPGLRQNVARAEADLKRFEQSVGYVKLKQDLNTASDNLSAAKAKLENLMAEESRLNTQVPSDKVRLAQLDSSLKSSEARLAQVVQRVAELDSALVSFDNAKAAIDAKINVINSDIQHSQANYLRHFH